MDIAIIVGNVSTLFAMAFNAFSSTRKTPKGVLLMQSASQAIYGLSSLVLGGYSASVQNVVSIIRNFAAIRKVNSKVLEWLLVILGVVLGVACNNLGWIGLLPVIGNLQYTLAIFRIKDDERKLKVFFLISVISFVIFNYTIRNYVGVVTDMFVAITTSIMLLKSPQKEETA